MDSARWSRLWRRTFLQTKLPKPEWESIIGNKPSANRRRRERQKHSDSVRVSMRHEFEDGNLVPSCASAAQAASQAVHLKSAAILRASTRSSGRSQRLATTLFWQSLSLIVPRPRLLVIRWFHKDVLIPQPAATNGHSLLRNGSNSRQRPKVLPFLCKPAPQLHSGTIRLSSNYLRLSTARIQRPGRQASHPEDTLLPLTSCNASRLGPRKLITTSVGCCL